VARDQRLVRQDVAIVKQVVAVHLDVCDMHRGVAGGGVAARGRGAALLRKVTARAAASARMRPALAWWGLGLDARAQRPTPYRITQAMGLHGIR
jgi:hypothetical protein